MTNKLRAPPAFQEYASDTLANMQFRLLSLPERGLWATMRMECWVNINIPSSPHELANILNLPISDVENNLTKRVLSFFLEKNKSLICTELEGYREKLATKSTAQAAGGKKGGQVTQRNHKEHKKLSEANLQANLEAKPKVLNRNEERRNDTKRRESPVKESSEDSNDSWIAAYEKPSIHEVNQYEKMSKGS